MNNSDIVLLVESNEGNSFEHLLDNKFLVFWWLVRLYIFFGEFGRWRLVGLFLDSLYQIFWWLVVLFEIRLLLNCDLFIIFALGYVD